ncbi:MAG: hypothetical protein LBS29_04530 [Endomicrobium sp.]|jgi:hypothetical protein|nr:hypothetical protein [Endomicrobium sp.]
MANAAEKMKRVAKRTRKKERFITLRMWFSTFIAFFYNDRGVIPPNIGNNIFIGNNIYTTRNSLNALIIAKEFSVETPIAFISDLINTVKGKVPNVTIDFTVKNKRHYVNLGSGDLKSRISTWEQTLSNPVATDYHKRRSARLLYTVSILRSGESLYKSVLYITVRAKLGTDLNKGIEQVTNYLTSIGCAHKIVKNDIRSHLDFVWLMSNRLSRKIKDLPHIMLSKQTMAEMMPMVQSANDSTGTFLGIDRVVQSPYFVNFRGTAKAKNIYIVATSGSGKTVLAQNWFMDMYADNYNMCIMDIKGTEFVAFTKATGGIVLSMKSNSTYYVNTFKMDKSEVKTDIKVYYDERFNLSKRMMLILCDLPDALTSRAESLLEEFLHSMYMQLGVLSDNDNTWERTNAINPYTVFIALQSYISPAVRMKYSDVADRILTRLSIYMSQNGSNSHMFRTPFEYKSILETKVLCFDFGLLDIGANIDKAMFKVRAMFMDILNDEFIAYKASKGEWTGKVLEESGIADDYLLALYAKDFMLRRSQNQVTILLGNSVSALVTNPNAKGILENITILAVGMLHRSSRDYLINEFGLDKYEDKLDLLSTNPDYENTFLLVNRMQKDATVAMLKAFVPESVIKGSLFKVVDVE